MDKNNVRNIDIDDDEILGELEKPENFVKIGSPAEDENTVYIKQDVYAAINRFSEANFKKEVGGALVGKVGIVNGITTVIVDAFIQAKHTDSTQASLTFTPETWAYLYDEREKNFPDKQIVGWHRTHPGDGISLSNYDMYIEENFFNNEYSVTLIEDPVNGQKAFYGKKNGRIAKMKGFYMYDDMGKKLNANIALSKPKTPAQPPQKAGTPQSHNKKNNTPVFLSLAVIVLLLIANLASSISLNMKFSKLVDLAETTENSQIQAEAIEKLADAVSSLKISDITPNVPENSDDLPENQNPSVPSDNNNIDNNTNGDDDADVNNNDNEENAQIIPENKNGETENDTPTITDDGNLPVSVPSPENPTTNNETNESNENQDNLHTDANGNKYFEYTVQAGEYISLICGKFGIDYETYADDIVRESGIANPDAIDVGQVILLPKLN